MITYEHQSGKLDSRGNRKWNINVRLDGKLVGEIRTASDGFYFKPKSGKRGLSFPTLVMCQRSLEA